MEKYLVLFREPDGRMNDHSEEDIQRHRGKWKEWLEKWTKNEKLLIASSLTLKGKLIRSKEAVVYEDIHKVGTEIVGGFLLLQAENLDEAVAIAQSCPIYEFEGYAEVREIQ